MTNTNTKRNVLHKWPLTVIAGLAIAGLSIGAYLAIMKLRLEYDVSYKPSCDLGHGVSCSVNQTSGYSTVLGLPVAVWSIPTYLLLLFLSLYSLIKRTELGEGRMRARGATEVIFAIGLLSVCYSIYLAYVSKFVLESICPWCMGLYLVNILILLCAFLSLGRSSSQLARDLANRVKALQPIPQTALIFGLSLTASVLWHNHMRDQMRADAVELRSEIDRHQKDQINKQFERERKAKENAIKEKNNLVAETAKTRVQPPKTRSKPKAVRTELGLTYYEAPIEDQDFAWGPADAPVTIVEFADFQCGFCRILSLNMRAVKKKFAGKIRVVFKHYPMDGSCNPRMGGNKMHEHACNAAKAAHCAGTQGKFWEMHDLLYDDQKNLDMEHLKERAQKLGLNLSQWNACLDSPSTVAKIRSDIKSAAQAGISGTPRMYINGRLLSGAASPAILSYMIEKSAEADRAPAVEQIAATPKSASQVSIKLADSSFFIDAFEASIDKNGRAVTRPNSHPAHVSWFDAKAACEKSNKRLCSEKEWVSSCTGQLAVDNNKNGFFADDDVEGRMYPYGDFYERGRCRDSEDKYKGTPGTTGSLAGCRTGTGIYDLAGNISEWVGNERRTAALVGGDYRSSSRASCNKRSAMYGPGYRNKTTGFRCCSDQPVQPGATKAELDDSSTRDVVDNPIAPDFFVTLEDGTQINANWFRGKTTYLTFFASWCGSCKRELPALNQVQLDYKARGLHILAIGTDRIKDRSLSFAKQFKPVYSIALDPDSTAMGLLKIDAMPASFLIDSKGVIRHRTIGFRPEDLTKLKSNLEGILGQ